MRLETFCPLLAVSSFFGKHILYYFISLDPLLVITSAVEVIAPVAGYEGHISIPKYLPGLAMTPKSH